MAREATGRTSGLAPFALIEDTATHVHDIAVEARLHCDGTALAEGFAGRIGDEYACLEVVAAGELDPFLAGNKGGVLPVSIAILEAKELIGEV